MSDFVVDRAQADRLAQVHCLLSGGLRRDVMPRVESLTFAEVVDAYWPAGDGWETLSVEGGYVYTMTLLQHPEHGVAACLLGTRPMGGIDAAASSADQWDGLDPWTRATWITGVMNAQAPSRAALVARLQAAYSATEYPALAPLALGSFLLSSQAFMDEVTSMFVALGEESLVGLAAVYQRSGAINGVPSSPLLVGEATLTRAFAWAEEQPLVQASHQMSRQSSPAAS